MLIREGAACVASRVLSPEMDAESTWVVHRHDFITQLRLQPWHLVKM